MGELLKELSVASELPEERRGALVELLKVARDDSPAVWEEHFKTMLLLLLETLGDKDVSVTTHTHTHTLWTRLHTKWCFGGGLGLESIFI